MQGLLILTVISYGTEKGDSWRVTYQPTNIVSLWSYERLVERQGMSLHQVIVKTTEHDEEVYVSGEDLRKLEDAVGCYGMSEEG
jgi:hypothetical protein